MTAACEVFENVLRIVLAPENLHVLTLKIRFKDYVPVAKLNH